MSEGFTSESLGAKVSVLPGEHERLRQGVLGLIDIAAATMANIGPAMSFYFGFGFLAFTAGLASPLTIIAAGVAILFLGNTLSEFTKVMPSTGGSSPSLVRPLAHAQASRPQSWILVPLYYLAKPGQPTPFNWYPYVALGVLILAFIYSVVLVNRGPGIGDRVGSIVADE
jgi:hypothetical protein